MPTIAFAMSVRVPCNPALPDRIVDCAGKRMATSNASPASICRFSVAALSNLATSLWPACRSNADPSSSRVDFDVGSASFVKGIFYLQRPCGSHPADGKRQGCALS